MCDRCKPPTIVRGDDGQPRELYEVYNEPHPAITIDRADYFAELRANVDAFFIAVSACPQASTDWLDGGVDLVVHRAGFDSAMIPLDVSGLTGDLDKSGG